MERLKLRLMDFNLIFSFCNERLFERHFRVVCGEKGSIEKVQSTRILARNRICILEIVIIIMDAAGVDDQGNVGPAMMPSNLKLRIFKTILVLT
jgi:hypothetical protein